MTLPIRVWPFHEAPPQFQALSPHGGDEDWLAHVPPHLADAWVPWAEAGSGFGRCDVSEHRLPGGSLVLIGAHA